MQARHRWILALVLLASSSSCGDNETIKIEYDRQVSIPGLDGKVSAFYDAQGVLSLRCESDADCLAAEGYFHAADRFFQMDLRRRFARGRLSELAGPVVMDYDHRSRSFIATKDGGRIEEQMWASASPETKLAVEAYTRGVNAWIDDLRNDRNGAKLSAEYDFMIIDKSVIADWEVLDSIACFLPVIDQLTNKSADDILAGEAIAKLGLGMGTDLFGVMVPSPSSTLPSSQAHQQSGPRSSVDYGKWLGALHEARSALGPERVVDEMGSNNWIVSPVKAGGKALLANDPHLTLSNPAIWYLVHIDAKTKGKGQLHIAGASFPGIPGILFGQNANLAWGVTTTFFDQSDVYVETLNEAGDAVIFNGAEVPIVEVEREYSVPNGAPSTRVSKYVPHHGPILSIDAAAGTAISLRWTAQDADTDFNFLWKMWTATTTAEAKAALADVTTVGQNFVIADKHGDIGWYPYNRIPSRPWLSETPPWRPLPGDGSAEWGPYLDYEQLPQATNPPAGFLATANNDMTGALYDGDPSNDDQQAVQSFTALGYRHERIIQLLDRAEPLSIRDMQSMQHDTKSLIGERVVPVLLGDLEGVTLSASASKVRDALQAWDFFCPTGFDNSDPSAPEKSSEASVTAASQGCAAFHVFWAHLRTLTFSDEMAAASGNFPLKHSALALAILRPEALSQSYWDDVATTDVEEDRGAIMTAAIEATALELVDTLGEDADSWRWGALHSVYLPADLFDAAGFTEYSYGPFMHDGGLATVDVAAPRNDLRGDYDHIHGASIRLNCEIGDKGPSCFYQLPGGQRHHRADVFYDSLLPNWLAHIPLPLPFSVKEIIDQSVDTIEVQ